MSKIIFVIVLLIVLVGVGYYVASNRSMVAEVNSYEECVAAGNPIMESYPEQCRTSDGKSFTRDISDEVTDEGVACTLEAKVCPDGSYVGRVAPSCEFSPCPTE